MKALDSRRSHPRLVPALLVGVAGAGALVVGWRISFPDSAAGFSSPAIPIAAAAAPPEPTAPAANAELMSLTSDANAAGPGPPLRRLDELAPAATVIQGVAAGSLYLAVEDAGAPPQIAARAVELFSRKLDLGRDIEPGDRFRLLIDDEAAAEGPGGLLYAEIGAGGRSTRLYGFRPQGEAEADFFDAQGRNIRGLLLRTPIDGAHVTSGFGMRLHPLLGYTRMHQGVDFGAPAGTPVYAAGDGVVEEADWNGGYGRWLKLGHAAGWETGYGHLAGWAVKAGQYVRQGQVIAYSGSSGESTGPHLHYEVMKDGVKINPAGRQVPAGAVLAGADMAAFQAERARVDALLDPDAATPQLARADTTKAAAMGLRASETP